MNFVDAAVDLRTDTLALRLTVPNPKQFLHAGQYVRVVVATRERPNAMLVPQRAVQLLQDKNYVWIVDARRQRPAARRQNGPARRRLGVRKVSSPATS